MLHFYRIAKLLVKLTTRPYYKTGERKGAIRKKGKVTPDKRNM